MIKILQVTGAMNRGGAEVMIMDIYRNIAPEFHFDFLINYNKKKGIVNGDFDNEILKKGGHLFQIPTQWDIGPKQYYREFKKIIEIVQPDIVHIHMNSKSGIIAWAAKKAGIQHVITHAHADIKFRGSFIYKLMANVEMKFQKFLINRYSNAFWGCSIEANHSLYYASKLNKENSTVINNAVDTNAYQNVSQDAIHKLRYTYDLNAQTLVIGNVGRIVSHKNILFIIDVLKVILSKGIDCKFVFAGRADDAEYLAEVRQKIANNQLNNAVIYLGLRADIPVVMNSFDVFVGPALKEGFGLVAVEAQAAGLPCVLYKGFPKSVDMELGLVAFKDDFSVEDWANEIIKMKNNKCNDKIVIKNKIMQLGFDSVMNTKSVQDQYLKLIQGT